MKRFWNTRRAQPPQSHQKWVPILGELQKTLQKREYLPLRPLPMFESNFVQVTNRGSPAFVHHRPNRLTMGVAASLPGLVMPDILLIALPHEGRNYSNLVLTRLIPLDLAHLYIHDVCHCRLKLRLVTGRYYYLELDAPEQELNFLFDRWIRLIDLLHQPSMSWAPKTISTHIQDTTLGSAPASTWHLRDQAQIGLAVEVAEPTFPYKTLTSQKQKKVKGHTLKQKFRSQAVGDSLPLIWSQLEPPDIEKATEKKSHLDACPERSKTVIHVSEKASFTIRTIFSIISGTVSQAHSSSKVNRSDSEGTTVRGDLIETPTQCISDDTRELPLMSSFSRIDPFLWPQKFEDLLDPESTTLSSSLHSSPYPPTFYVFPPNSSFQNSGDKGRAMDSTKYQRPLPSQKTTSVPPVTSGKTPFILDQSQRVPVVPTPVHKAPITPAVARKVPTKPCSTQKAIPSLAHKPLPISVVNQKIPVIPGPSRKASCPFAPPQKTLPPIQKFPPVSAVPRKAMPPRKDCLVPSTRFQKVPISTPQCRQVLNLPNPWAKARMDLRLLLAEKLLEKRKCEKKQEPVVLVGGQKTEMVDVQTQAVSLQLPFTTTKKESKELLTGRTQEVALEVLKGREKSEEQAHKKEEETAVDMPGLKSKEIEKQKKWIVAKELTIEGSHTEDKRPFSVEGLTLAKMMIMANSKKQQQNLASISPPSWLSVTSRTSAMCVLTSPPFNHKEMNEIPSPEETPPVVKELSESQASVKEENTQSQAESKPAGDSVVASPGPSNPTFGTNSSEANTYNPTQVPIATPASCWEDLSPCEPTPLSTASNSNSGVSAKVPQKPEKKPQEPKKEPKQQQHPASTSSRIQNSRLQET